ncbi:nitroreductase/quinone reductase family protein [Streptomyces sp. CBMA29]|uniref:nitroreductase/quinone reductase family protein n=1 Tax=Streptomyces sp. CBMA29 TaxID=1896314 RepID=UPI001661AF7E|nr:nitroreductase/quinone reductase family protein [Streptomyces sp. CBMA29]
MQTTPKPTEDSMAEPMGDTSVIKDTEALSSFRTTRPDQGLDAGPITRAFMRVNVYIYSKPPKKVQKSLSKGALNVHIWLYEKSNGRIGGKMGNLDALLLHTLGRKTGKERVVPIGYIYERGFFYAVAVPGHFDIPGGPKGLHPAWYLNLKATPEVTVNIGRERIVALAETLSGPERDRIWARYSEVLPFINEFQNRASRLLPVVKFTPKDMLAAAPPSDSEPGAVR